MPKPTVVQTLSFRTASEASNRLAALSARYVKQDDETGLRLYKTAAGVVLREKSAVQYEVMANCAC